MSSKILFIAIVLVLCTLGLLTVKYIFPVNKQVYNKSKEALLILSEKKSGLIESRLNNKLKIQNEPVLAKSQRLSAVSPDDDKEIDKLIKELVNEDLEISQKAAENLIKLGGIAILKLAEALKGADVGLKGQIIFLLGRIGDKKAAPVLVEMLKDENAYIRRNSAEALGKIKDEESLYQLSIALFDDDPGVRERSSWAMGESKNALAVENLLNRLSDEKEKKVKVSVVNALGKLNDARATSMLLAELKSQSDQLYKNEVAQALGKAGNRSALLGLQEYLNNLKQYNPTEKMIIFQWEQAIKIAEEAIEKVQNKL